MLEMNARNGVLQGQRVYELRGPLLMETVQEFLRALREETAREVILDLSGVSRADSSGIGALVQLLVRYRKNQQELVLSGPNGFVLAALEITGVHNLFRIHPTLAESQTA